MGAWCRAWQICGAGMAQQRAGALCLQSSFAPSWPWCVKILWISMGI